MIEQVLIDTDSKMQKALDALTRDLAAIRTGRATPALVEHIRIDYHGVPTPLNQIASISVPEAKMIVIQPWDRSAIRSIEKAILTAELGLNPTSDSNVIRIVIPPLTEERRKELTRVVRNRLEETRVTLRNIRREGMERSRRAEKDKEISQDECAHASERLQELTDSFIQRANQTGQDKETEIMEV